MNPATLQALRPHRWQAGRWYGPGGAGATNALTNDALFMVLLQLPKPLPIDRLWCDVKTAGTAGALIRLGAYEQRRTNIQLIVDAGTVPGDSTGQKTLEVGAVLPAGFVYLCAVGQGAPATAPVLAMLGNAHAELLPIRDSSLGAAAARGMLPTVNVGGELPGVLTLGGSTPVAPLLRVRAAP